MAGGLFTINTNPYSRDNGARLVPFLSQVQEPTPDQQAAIAAGLQTGLLGGTEKQAQAAADVAQNTVKQVQQSQQAQQDDPVKWAAQQNRDELIQRALSMQNASPDQMRERDVLYSLPIGNGRWDSGNIYQRPFVKNDNGTTSTMVSQVFTDDNGNHVIMNVTPDGKILSDEDAQKRYYEVGDNGVATFDNLDDALKFDNALHPREVQRLKYQNNPAALQQYAYDLERADHPEWFDQSGAYIGQQAQQAQPQTAADAVTQATLQGAAKEQAQAQQQYSIPLQQGSLISGLLTNPTPTMVDIPVTQARQGIPMQGAQGMAQGQRLSALGRDLANQLIRAKQLYAQAQQAGSQKGMDAAHAAALSIRQSAAAAGIDLSGFGADDTQQDAAQNLQDDYYRGIQNALYSNLDVTSDDYYNRIYQGLRQRGYNEEVSRNEAARRAGIYQAQRMSQLTDALYQYGLSPRGSINQIGTRLLAMMSDENANKANYYANMFAGPKQDYAFDRQQDTASAQQAYKEKNMATKQGYDLQQMQYKTQLTEHLREIEGKIKMAEQSHEYGLKAQLEAYKGQIKKELANINGQWGVAKAQASGKGKSGSSGGEKLTEGQKEIQNTLEYMWDDVKADPSADNVKKIHDFLNEESTVKHLSSEDRETTYYFDLASQFLYYKKAGYDGGENDSSGEAMSEVCRQIANYMPDDWRELLLPGEDFSGWKE